MSSVVFKFISRKSASNGFIIIPCTYIVYCRNDDDDDDDDNDDDLDIGHVLIF